MSDLKIVMVGAGSFVFGASMLSQAIVENDLGTAELALVDLDSEMLELMAGVGRRMVEVTGKPITISTTTDRREALPGADYVICSVAVQGFRRQQMDVEQIKTHYPTHLITEFGGVAGISYSLRQIGMIQALVADMKDLCPSAWLLNVSNPLPRVCQVAQEAGIETVGFCSVAEMVYSKLWRLYEGSLLHYPFQQAKERWQITTAGVNHLAWLVEMREKSSGEDKLPDLRQRISEGGATGNPVGEAELLRTGSLLSAGDDHIRDFLEPSAHSPQEAEVFHGSPDERQRRINILQAVGDGSQHWDVLLEHCAWERPMDFIAARQSTESVYFPALNRPNHGQMPGLPEGVFVETPVNVSASGVNPVMIHLPEGVLPRTVHTAHVTQAIVQAALSHDREGLYYAAELDPTITDKTAGKQALDACLKAHADLLPAYQ